MQETMIKALMASMGLNPEGIKAQLTQTLTEFRALVNEFRQRDDSRKAQLDAVLQRMDALDHHKDKSITMDRGSSEHNSDLQTNLHSGTGDRTNGETGTVSH